MSKSINHISVVIIASNANKTIKDCLSSLIAFEEVVLYLNNSTDSTRDIASTFQNVIIVDGPFLGFGKTKQKAIGYASNNWVFSLDSDEVVSDVLVNTLISKTLDDATIYSVRRHSFYKKRRIYFSGLQNERIIRLFNKNFTGFNDLLVHEFIDRKKLTLQFLNGYIDHHSFLSISDFIQKIDSYSSLYANQNEKYSSPFIALVKSVLCFLKVYFLQLGFLDGYIGFLVSYSSATGVFYKYLKLYEKNNNL